MSQQPDDMKKRWSISGLAIPAGLFIGMGVGFIIDDIAAGIFLGLGAGFLVMLVAAIVMQLKSG